MPHSFDSVDAPRGSTLAAILPVTDPGD